MQTRETGSQLKLITRYGTVHFDTDPRGAQIIVDGQVLVGPNEESIKTPATVQLIEGRRDFILHIEDSNDEIGYVDVLGTTVNIFRNMTPGTKEEWAVPKPQIYRQPKLHNDSNVVLTYPKTGVLMVYSFPDGAYLYVNGKYVGEAPLAVTDVPAGVATVIWKMPGMMDEGKIVDIVEGTWSETFATMRPVLPKLSTSSDNYMDYKNTDYQNTDNKIEGDIMNTMQQIQYPSGSMGNVTITSYPEGATVCIDGSVLIDQLGTPIITPVTLTLPEGDHAIALELDGYYTGYEYIYMYPSAELSTSTNLAKMAYMSTIRSMQYNIIGDTIVDTYPQGANIYIDGYLLADTNMTPILTPATISLYMGYHDLRFALDGFYDEFWSVYTIPGDTQYIYRNFNVARSC